MQGWRKTAAMLWAAAGLFIPAAARAEVLAAQPGGFEVRERAHVAAPPDKVWAALGRPAAWWSPDHTFSGDARNLSLEVRAGGCLCERWSGGDVRHMSVVAVFTGSVLRLEGALGPLGGMGLQGHLTYALKPADGGTDLVVDYAVGGWSKEGLDQMAAPVDQVLGLLTTRLARYAATGAP